MSLEKNACYLLRAPACLLLLALLVAGSPRLAPPAHAAPAPPVTPTRGDVQPQSGAPLLVDSTLDEVDAVPGDGYCSSAPSQKCTLRAAVMESNATPGQQEIVLPAGRHELTLRGRNENRAVSGDLDITDSLVVRGAGADATIIHGGRRDRVLHIGTRLEATSTITVSLHDLAIRGGFLPNDHLRPDRGGGIMIRPGAHVYIYRGLLSHNRVAGNGGAIFTKAPLTLEQTTIYSNTAGWGGGGLALEGTLVEATILDSTIASNVAVDGGGIHNAVNRRGELALTLRDSTISGNWARIFGGGLLNAIGGSNVQILNSTFSGNYAGLGGAIGNDGGSVVLLENSTVVSNTAQMGGGIGDVHAHPRFIQLRGTIFTLNTASSFGPNCFGKMTSLGHNLLGDLKDCIVATQPTDVLGLPPMLGPLAANGGPTHTHALQVGSPAIDALAAEACPPADQRGVARPVDGDSDQEAHCDIGAFELVP